MIEIGHFFVGYTRTLAGLLLWSKIYFLTTDEDEEKELIKELKEDEVDYETTKIK